jgi:hypothetical protein
MSSPPIRLRNELLSFAAGGNARLPLALRATLC